MKINEKWLLFSISTFTVLFGISGHLLSAPKDVMEDNNLILNDTNNNLNDSRYLAKLSFNEGIIDFNPDTYEYWIDVFDYDNLEVYPVVSSIYDYYKVIKEDNNIKIIVTKMDESFKEYIIHVNELKDNEIIE